MPGINLRNPDVRPNSRRHSLRVRTRPGGAFDLGSHDLLSGFSRAPDPSPGAWVLAHENALARAIRVARLAFSHRHRDSSGREDRSAREKTRDVRHESPE